MEHPDFHHSLVQPLHLVETVAITTLMQPIQHMAELQFNLLVQVVEDHQIIRHLVLQAVMAQ